MYVIMMCFYFSTNGLIRVKSPPAQFAEMYSNLSWKKKLLFKETMIINDMKNINDY